MRKDLAKAVIDRFSERLGELIPGFKRDRKEAAPSGSALFRLSSGTLTFFVLLQLHRNEDWFTVELAWSARGHLPETSDGQVPDTDMPPTEAAFRLGKLWAPKRDVWWELAPKPPDGAGILDYMLRVPLPEAMARVEPLVDDAVAKIHDHGAPVFKRVLESQSKS